MAIRLQEEYREKLFQEPRKTGARIDCNQGRASCGEGEIEKIMPGPGERKRKDIGRKTGMAGQPKKKPNT